MVIGKCEIWFVVFGSLLGLSPNANHGNVETIQFGMKLHHKDTTKGFDAVEQQHTCLYTDTRTYSLKKMQYRNLCPRECFQMNEI